MQIIIKQGKGLFRRWRWQIWKGDEYKGGCGVWGFRSQGAAEQDAMETLGNAVEIETSDGPLFAGLRDFE